MQDSLLIGCRIKETTVTEKKSGKSQDTREAMWKALEERGYTRNGGTPAPQIKRPSQGGRGGRS